MRAAAVIPAFNAVKRGLWTQLLDSAAVQTLPLEQKIIIDSDSDDGTCAVAESYGWKCRKIRREDFNHGLTRTQAVSELLETGIDTVVFLSQDVILTTPDTLMNLTAFLWDKPVSGCYGKQRSRRKNSFDTWQRLQSYPEKSAVKTLNDVPQSGLMTVFFSNAFSAWKTADVMQYGGFPETDFGEDTLLAANVLNHGGAVGYCAEAEAVHEHSDKLRDLFVRGAEVGTFHRNHPELLRQFCRKLPKSSGPFPWRLLPPLALKLAGYAYGRSGKKFFSTLHCK